MSRIGKNPVAVLDGVTVEQKAGIMYFKGPKGEMELAVHPNLKIVMEGKQITVERASEENLDRSLHGLTRTLIANAVQGVKEGFTTELLVFGVGFKGNMQGNKLNLALGFSHPVEFVAPKGITITVRPDEKDKNTFYIAVQGADKQLVGEVAAKIKNFKKPEPYKGKGIRYIDEKIRRKAGKSAAK